MKTKTNEIIIDANTVLAIEKYDFFELTTSENFIKRGASALDLEGKANAESIAFTGGHNAYIMFRKNTIKTHELQSLIKDPTLSIKKLDFVKPDMLASLLLNAMGNSQFEGFSFHNLTGHLFYYIPEWVGKSSIKALDVSLVSTSSKYRLDFSACTFTDLKRFKTQPSDKLPRYALSLNGTFRRVFVNECTNDSTIYVKTTLGSKKTEIPFFNFFAPKMKATKVSAAYTILNAFNERYKGLCQIEFVTREIKEKLTLRRDEDFVIVAKQHLEGKTINIINYDLETEDNDIFLSFYSRLKDALPNTTIQIADNFDKNCLNIVFLHNKDYYKNNPLNDPYASFARNMVVQAITAEDGASAQSETVLNTIIKELVIKDDIINTRHITMDNWADFGFTGPISFGIMDDDTARFLEILPDGAIKTIRPVGIFGYYKEQRYSYLKSLLLANKKNGSIIIQNQEGSIIIIQSAGINTLPFEEVLTSTSPRGSRSKEELIAGLIDINLYQDGENYYYNVGPVGQNLNMSLPRGSLLYQVVLKSGHNFIEDLLKTMSVLFVKYNSFTVLPYPIKYLKEWAQMEKQSQMATN